MTGHREGILFLALRDENPGGGRVSRKVPIARAFGEMSRFCDRAAGASVPRYSPAAVSGPSHVTLGGRGVGRPGDGRPGKTALTLPTLLAPHDDSIARGFTRAAACRSRARTYRCRRG